jgi:hypothetical protein
MAKSSALVLYQNLNLFKKERLGETKEFTDTVESIVGSTYLTGCIIRLDGGVRTPKI